MNREAEAAIVAECQRLAQAFGKHVDYGEAEDAAALFTEDCTFERRGEVLRGRAAIVAAQHAHPLHLVVRHHCLTPVVRVIDEHTAEGVTYFTTYRHVGSEAEAGPAPLDGPDTVGDFIDVFKRTAEGWRIAHRRASAVFRRPPRQG